MVKASTLFYSSLAAGAGYVAYKYCTLKEEKSFKSFITEALKSTSDDTELVVEEILHKATLAVQQKILLQEVNDMDTLSNHSDVVESLLTDMLQELSAKPNDFETIRMSMHDFDVGKKILQRRRSKSDLQVMDKQQTVESKVRANSHKIEKSIPKKKAGTKRKNRYGRSAK